MVDLGHGQHVHPGVVGPEHHDPPGRHEHGRRARSDRRRCQSLARIDVERDHGAVVGVRHERQGAVAQPGQSDRACRTGACSIGRLERQPGWGRLGRTR